MYPEHSGQDHVDGSDHNEFTAIERVSGGASGPLLEAEERGVLDTLNKLHIGSRENAVGAEAWSAGGTLSVTGEIAEDAAPPERSYGPEPREIDVGFNGAQDLVDDGSAILSNQSEVSSAPNDNHSLLASANVSPAPSVPISRALSPNTAGGPRRRPFGQRFSSQFFGPGVGPARSASSTVPWTHSRTPSVTSQAWSVSDLSATTEPHSAPWEAVSWTRLRKVSAEASSEAAKRKYGNPTCFAVSALIAIGMSRGVILVFDQTHNLKAIIGLSTQAHQSGPVLAVSISPDHAAVAAGHKDGSINVWSLAKPSSPMLHISPLKPEQIQSGKVAGHLIGTPIIHIAFLSNMSTAIVSSDLSGMAFSHIAQRSITLISLSCVSARILGRYFYDQPATDKPRRASTVLALASLPLGNMEQKSDDMGIVALITPYLMVIISCVPIARTQYKLNRPSELQKHGMMSAALAWFPAVKAHTAGNGNAGVVPSPKLVFSWANVLQILEMRTVENPKSASVTINTELAFHLKTRWIADEPIVAVQWFSRSLLAVLTVTQRLIILEEATLRSTESLDLSQRHVFHSDLFSKQLRTSVDVVDEADNLHGVTADAFYQSVKTYKSRIYLLGFHELWIGALANWADRLLATMNAGDAIGAIRLATSYYVGDEDRLIVGLPEDDLARKRLVQDKLLGLMSAAVDFTLGGMAERGASQQTEDAEVLDLADTCIKSSILSGQLDFLFEAIFDGFEQHGHVQVFLGRLEDRIMDGSIQSVPPPVMKRMVQELLDQDSAKLENLICHMRTEMMDLDMMTRICTRYKLYDSTIFIYNEGLEDWITPSIQLMTLIDQVNLQRSGQTSNRDADSLQLDIDQANASKMFPYLSYALTGRVYPTEAAMLGDRAVTAKSQLLYFLFAGRPIPWPQPGGSVFHLGAGRWRHTTFAYLKAILLFDTSAFLNVLDEEFEDDFLNDDEEEKESPIDSQLEYLVFADSINRQYIVTILLEILQGQDFDKEDLAYLDIFLARNMPKYPQYLRLPEAELDRILVRLCSPPSKDLNADCQLSVEYLLSVYHPPNTNGLILQLQEARYWNVLKSIYRTQHDYVNLIQTSLEDLDDTDSVFRAIEDALTSADQRHAVENEEIETLIRDHASDLLNIDLTRTSSVIDRLLPQLHASMLTLLEKTPERQYSYLRVWCEPDRAATDSSLSNISANARRWLTLYVRLMCRFQSDHVKSFVQNLQLEDLQLDDVLHAMEENEVVDASVTLMARAGQLRRAMDRLITQLVDLSSLLVSLSSDAEKSDSQSEHAEAILTILRSVQRYISIGIWLCQYAEQNEAGNVESKKGKLSANHPIRSTTLSPEPTAEEALWLDLLIASIQLTQQIPTDPNTSTIKAALRTTIQTIFTALLRASTSTSQSSTNTNSTVPKPRFLPIFRALLTQISAATPSLNDVRAVCTDIFASYTFEESLLAMVHQMQDRDLFARVDLVRKGRERGWRPGGVVCDGCGGRIWGTGAGGGVWRAWIEGEREKEKEAVVRRENLEIGKRVSQATGEGGKGKGRERVEEKAEGKGATRDGGDGDTKPDSLVMFSCRHSFHKECLEKLQKEEVRGQRYLCPLEKARIAE